jgi:tRNA pseudouridine55 synthase
MGNLKALQDVASRPGRAAVLRRIDGVLLLDKPVGLSSNAALQRVKRLYRAEKAGHTGTLDPLASGLLPICFGEATKFAQALLDADKAYLATVRFGTTTSTGDADGDVLASRAVTITRPDIEAILPRFVGRIGQVPPRHAALKHEGRKYYEYARRGIDIPRVARPVEIRAIDVISWKTPNLEVSIRCGKGTYVRALAEDIGAALGCGAHLAALRRSATGGFALAQAHSFEMLETASDARRDAILRPVDTLVAELPRLDLEGADATRFGQGQALARAEAGDAVVRVYADGVFAGVGVVAGGVLRARRLMTVGPRVRAVETVES